MRLSRAARLLLTLLFLLWHTEAALADSQAPLILTEEDVGNGYRYEAVGIGSFTVNGRDQETLPAVVIDFESEMEAVLYCGGEEIPFTPGELIIDNGVYELYLYREGRTDGIFGVFHFTVENDFDQLLTQQPEKIQVVENPPLRLSGGQESGGFLYTLPNGKSFEMDVPLGGTARHAVRLSFSDGLAAYTAKRNGEAMLMPEDMIFREPGHYEIMVSETVLSMAESVTYRTGIWFTLKSAGPEPVSLVNAPSGFVIQSVRYEGRELTDFLPRAAVLKKDGVYEVNFADSSGLGLHWTDTITRDTMPPSISFDREVDGKVLEKDVAFLPPKRGERMEILLDGIQVTASMNRIAQNGSYRITLWDAAGNSREYCFIMRQGYLVFDKTMIAALLVLLLLVGAFCIHWRRDMRVL